MYRIFVAIFAGVAIVASAGTADNKAAPKETGNKTAGKNGNQPVAKAPDEPRHSPYDAVRIAAEDAALVVALNQPVLEPARVRYLSLHNFPLERRLKLKQTVDFVVNSLSKRRTIVRTAGLPDPANPIILRVNLADYGINTADWDKLAITGSGVVPLPDPYFHQILFEDVKRMEDRQVEGKDEYGRTVMQTRKVEVTVKQPKIQATAVWLAAADNGESIKALVTLTQTANPILRADWFVTYATWAPAYYTMLGINSGKEVDFAKLVFRDEARARKSAIAAIADTRIVAFHNRIIVREPTVNGYVGGYWWETNDTDTGIDKEDYLNNIDTFDKPSFKAKEVIATLTNTLQAYALANNKGELLNAAATNIAMHGDTMPTRLQDKTVFAGRNCMICHAVGINKIKCNVRALANNKIALFEFGTLLSSPERFKLRDVREKIIDAFGPSIDDVVGHDQVMYSEAVKACNGLNVAENAKQFEEFVYEYLEAPITLETAAAEAGLDPKELEEIAKKGILLDYAMTGWLQKPPVYASRTHWERTGHDKYMLHLLATKPRK